jgi:hypothetical protein
MPLIFQGIREATIFVATNWKRAEWFKDRCFQPLSHSSGGAQL